MSEDEEQETIEEKDEQEGGVNDSDLDLLDDEEDQPQQMTEDHADGASDVEMVDEGIRPEYERDDDGYVMRRTSPAHWVEESGIYGHY